jgi:predicted nucleotidyltransferase
VARTGMKASAAGRTAGGFATFANQPNMALIRREPKHLPRGKQRELAFVVEILLEEFRKVVASRKAPRLRDGQVLKIILFGFYAREDWVEDPIGRYFSDYDFLIIVDQEDLADTVESGTRPKLGSSRSFPPVRPCARL